MDAYELARQRVDNTPELEQYAAFCLNDWNEGDKHYTWIANAPIAEIVDWAKSITFEE